MQNIKTTKAASAKTAQIHTSVLLQELIDGAPADHFTLDWLVGNMPKHSFGIIMLFLALLSLLPVISVITRLLFLFLALQIMLGYHSPVLPRLIMARKLPSRYLVHLNRHAIPALRHLEKGVRPRWPTLLIAARRITALIAVLLTILSLIAPLPLANMPPAAVSALMALAYIEHDGLLLLVALFFGNRHINDCERGYPRMTRRRRQNMRTPMKRLMPAIILAAGFLYFYAPAMAQDQQTLPEPVQSQLHAKFTPVGSGTYRKFGFRVYNATLWAPGGVWDAKKPYALQLTYTRDVSKGTLIDTVMDDIRDQDVADETTLARWQTDLTKTLTDVQEGDTLIAVNIPGKHSMIFFNTKLIATIDEQPFCQAFFNVWLGDKADESLKAKLLAQKK